MRLAFYLGALRRALRRAQLVHVMANSGWAWHLRAAPAPRRSPGQSPHLVGARNLEPIYDMPTGLRAFAMVRATFLGCG